MIKSAYIHISYLISINNRIGADIDTSRRIGKCNGKKKSISY